MLTEVGSVIFSEENIQRLEKLSEENYAYFRQRLKEKRAMNEESVDVLLKLLEKKERAKSGAVTEKGGEGTSSVRAPVSLKKETKKRDANSASLPLAKKQDREDRLTMDQERVSRSEEKGAYPLDSPRKGELRDLPPLCAREEELKQKPVLSKANTETAVLPRAISPQEVLKAPLSMDRSQRQDGSGEKRRDVKSPEALIERQEQEVVRDAISNEEVTKHTASLWKYLPIDTEEPEPHSEWDYKALELGRGRLLGARVRGKKHKHEGTNSDDWFCMDTQGDWIFIAVSDGAGSKKYARIGAKSVCERATQFLRQETRRFVQDDAFLSKLALPFSDPQFSSACGQLAEITQKAVLEAISAAERAFLERKGKQAYERALQRELNFGDFSGTLLVCMAIPLLVEGSTEYLMVSCQIGDGMLAVINEKAPFSKALKLLGEPDGGAFAGETDFFTAPSMKKPENLMKRTKVSRSALDSLLVMTDGVSDDYFPHSPQLLRLYLDLRLNGILGSFDTRISQSKENRMLHKKIPEPLGYPWVDDPKVIVPIQYANRVMQSTGISLPDLWEDREQILTASSLEFCGLLEKKTAEERLKVWLDNYVERGSFDDRTLVIFYGGNLDGKKGSSKAL